MCFLFTPDKTNLIHRRKRKTLLTEDIKNN
nr:MAG TPA: hypothetical protein [Bacteriophage sp.]